MSSISLKSGFSYNPSPDNLAATQSAIGVLELQWQPDLIDLSAADRRALRKMGPRSVDFVSKTLSYAKANPHMVPGFVDLDAFEKDLAAYVVLQEMVSTVAKIFDMAEDSVMALGSKVLGNGLACYAGFQSAEKQGQPGAAVIVGVLSDRFAKQGKPPKRGVPPADVGGAVVQ
jgi:hypothetical protein